MFNILIMNTSSKQKYESWSPFRYEIDCILACAEYGNITKAAERVGLTQASLSKVIQKIESSVGSQLFVRSPRGIQMTQTGKEFVFSLKNIRSHWGEFIKENRNEESYGLAEVSIGSHTSVANRYFPRMLGTLATEYPDTTFKFEFKRSVEITQKVAKSELDIGLVVNPIRNSDLVARPFSQGFIALWGQSKNLSDTVLYSNEMFLSEKILKTVRDKALVEVNDYEVIANILKATNLSGLLPSTVAERFGLQMQSGKLLSVDLNLIYRKDRFFSKNQKVFIAKVSQLLSQT